MKYQLERGHVEATNRDDTDNKNTWVVILEAAKPEELLEELVTALNDEDDDCQVLDTSNHWVRLKIAGEVN